MDFKFLTDNVGRRVIVARPLGIAKCRQRGLGRSCIKSDIGRRRPQHLEV